MLVVDTDAALLSMKRAGIPVIEPVEGRDGDFPEFDLKRHDAERQSQSTKLARELHCRLLLLNGIPRAPDEGRDELGTLIVVEKRHLLTI
jgi:hypothetical protein